MNLVEYGIFQEKSDLRAHVSVVGRCVYVYQTKIAVERVKKYLYRKAPAYTGSQVTAEGFLVPPDDIGSKCLEIPSEVYSLASFSLTDNTSQKGNKAVFVVKSLLKRGLFPLESVSEIVEDRDMQINGYDITVKLNFNIQVKCDWKCGDRSGCSGNLYIQIAERNINKMH